MTCSWLLLGNTLFFYIFITYNLQNYNHQVLKMGVPEKFKKKTNKKKMMAKND